ARAAAPMLPGCEVATSTMRTATGNVSGSDCMARVSAMFLRAVCQRARAYSTLPAEMHGMVNIAIRAARRAGELMIRQMNQLDALQVTEKSRNDFVTQVDRAAEAAIIEVI